MMALLCTECLILFRFNYVLYSLSIYTVDYYKGIQMLAVLEYKVT